MDNVIIVITVKTFKINKILQVVCAKEQKIFTFINQNYTHTKKKRKEKVYGRVGK